MTTEALNGPQEPERRPERSQTPERAPEAATGEASGAHEASEASGPVAELRTAVAKLRDLVGNLGDNQGPWSVHVFDGGYPQSIRNASAPYLVAECHEPPSTPVFSLAPYIATMHPAVGGMLAGWLHLVADVIEARIAEDGTDRRAVDANGDYALRIARLINGETGEP